MSISCGFAATSSETRFGPGLVARAEQWPWSSFHKRDPACAHRPGAAELLDDWPIARPPDWTEWVNRPESTEELAAMRNCCQRQRPYGDEPWAAAIASQIGAEQSFRPRGRPRAKPALDRSPCK